MVKYVYELHAVHTAILLKKKFINHTAIISINNATVTVGNSEIVSTNFTLFHT